MTIENLFNFINENIDKRPLFLLNEIKGDKSRYRLLKRLAVAENSTLFEKLDKIVSDIKIYKNVEIPLLKQKQILKTLNQEQMEEENAEKLHDDNEIYAIKNIKKSILKHYNEEDIEKLKAAVKACARGGTIYGLQEMFPDVYIKLNRFAFMLGLEKDKAIVEILEKPLKINTEIAFASEKQARNYIIKLYLDHREEINRIREDPKAIKALKLLFGNKVYNFFEENGFKYGEIAYSLDVLNAIKSKAKQLESLSIFKYEQERTSSQIKALIKKVKLPNPNKEGEFLTEEELIGELGSSWNGKSPKPIYTEAVVINLYKNFIKKYKAFGIKEPNKFLYDDLAVAYGVTKYAEIKGFKPTDFAKVLDKFIDKMVIVNSLTGKTSLGFPINMEPYLKAALSEEKKSIKAK